MNKTNNKTYSTFDMLNVIGSVRHALNVSCGMTAIEDDALMLLEEKNIIGKPVLNAKQKKQKYKHKLELDNDSRKTGTYEVDAIFKKGSTFYLIDIKPPSHDNSVPPQQHFSKFLAAQRLFKATKGAKSKVEMVLAVYGRTKEELASCQYFTYARKHGIKTISLLDIGFDANAIKERTLKSDGKRLVLRAMDRLQLNNKQLEKDVYNLIGVN